jgi:hypothetical protein
MGNIKLTKTISFINMRIACHNKISMPAASAELAAITREHMKKTITSVALASLLGATLAPAHAGLLTFQGVTFHSTWSDKVLTLEIDAAGRNGNWAAATGLAALELDGIGDYTGASVSYAPNGSAGWAISSSELNAQGCSGDTNGQAGSRLCFFGKQVALADDMLFSFTFNGSAIRTVDPHVKVQFVDSNGKKAGDLLSQTLPSAPAIDTPPSNDRPHAEAIPTSTGIEAGSSDKTAADVPEPQSIALLLAGLGLMGLALRRKRPS